MGEETRVLLGMVVKKDVLELSNGTEKRSKLNKPRQRLRILRSTFKELAQACEVLSDLEKGKIYDQYGEDVLKDGMSGGGRMHNPFALEEGMGGGDGKEGRRCHPSSQGLSGRSLQRDIQKAFFNKERFMLKVQWWYERIKISIRQLGSSMIQHMQHPCNECRGTGETINDKDRCTNCKGEKVVQQKKVLEVIVEKGHATWIKDYFPWRGR